MNLVLEPDKALERKIFGLALAIVTEPSKLGN
jgi:hypothetical protein